MAKDIYKVDKDFRIAEVEFERLLRYSRKNTLDFCSNKNGAFQK